jgi:hypothetical protein
VRSFKIEGRYKDMGYVKNITAHYRRLLDEILDEREASGDPLARASSGRTTFTFTPDPLQNFNREFTDYFVNGRKEDIGAFDTPKNPGQAIGWVTKLGPNFVELEVSDTATVLHNGDGLCYYDLQKGTGGPADQPRRTRVAARRPAVARVSERPDGGFQGPAQRHRGQPQPRHRLGAHAGEEVQRPAHCPVGAVRRDG